MENTTQTSCLNCKYFHTFASTFYDDDFVDFSCSNAGRRISRQSARNIKECKVPKWCPLLNENKKDEDPLDDDDD